MACRDTKKNCKLSKGQEAIVSKAAQEKIAANVRRMCPTSEFDSAFKNIIECASSAYQPCYLHVLQHFNR
jgi:hypothetical protein